jgi:hypothetical protein
MFECLLIVIAVFTDAIREYHDTRNGTVVDSARMKDVKAGKRFVKSKDVPKNIEPEVSDTCEMPKRGRPFNDKQARPTPSETSKGLTDDHCSTSVELEYENDDEMGSEDVNRKSTHHVSTDNMFERIKKRNEISAVVSTVSSASCGNLGLYV